MVGVGQKATPHFVKRFHLHYLLRQLFVHPQQHELDNVVLELVLDDSPTALESFQHVLHDAALEFALDETVAVASVDVDVVEQDYNYLLFVF